MFKILIIANLLSLLCFLNVYPDEFTAFAEVPSMNDTLQQKTNQSLVDDKDFIKDEAPENTEAASSDVIENEPSDFIKGPPFPLPEDFLNPKDLDPSSLPFQSTVHIITDSL